MQEEEKNNGMEGMSVEEMFLGVQESYQEAQLRAQEENRAFARTEFFRMDKFGTYRLRILPIAPNPDGSPTRPPAASGAGETRYGEQAPKDVCHCHPRYRCRI